MIRRFTSAITLLLFSILFAAAQPAPSPVLQAMKAELDRSMEKFKTQPVPPYFLSYEIVESRGANVSAEFGKIVNSGESRYRQLDIDLRVGDYNLDNTREIRGGNAQMGFENFRPVAVPIDDDPDAIRAVLWHNTDERYKRAVEQLTKVKTNVQVKVAQEDQSADFSNPSGSASRSSKSRSTGACGKRSCASTRRPSPSTPTFTRQPPFCKRPPNRDGM
jgi:hypothetical protein